MGKMSRRRSGSSEEEGGAYWMDTYGDMVTLLLTFFVFLFAFSTIDITKWQNIVASFSGANFSAMPAIDFYTASEPPVQPFSFRTEEDVESSNSKISEEDMRMFEALLASITEYIDDNELQAQVIAHPETKTIILRFSDNVLFTSGKADLLPAFRYTMDHVISLLDNHMDMIGMIRIEGHTDDVPIHNAQFEDNWDLSSKRATNVLRYFIDSGNIDVTKISVTGYGEFHPVDTNETVEGRSANRRVDFVIESITIQ
ncbi:MAG: flagellar motor protein MotB [Clostridiales bacterium]|nr:flagellar motor protein MotB [Clostridiales bacterium]